MMRCLFVIVAILMISCKGDKQEGYYKEQIIGDWQRLPVIQNPGEPLPPPPPMNVDLGFSFSEDGIIESKIGFFDDNPFHFAGFESTYRIVNDSLIYTAPDSKKDERFKINVLTKDSLVLDGVAYKRLNLVPDGEKFDALVFKNSSIQIYINDKGTFRISGSLKEKTKRAEKQFTREEFDKIQQAFMKAGYEKLNAKYQGDFICADCMDSDITVTFYKNGKVLKTISDSGQGSPMPFLWACLRLQYLPYYYKLSFETR